MNKDFPPWVTVFMVTKSRIFAVTITTNEQIQICTLILYVLFIRWTSPKNVRAKTISCSKDNMLSLHNFQFCKKTTLKSKISKFHIKSIFPDKIRTTCTIFRTCSKISDSTVNISISAKKQLFFITLSVFDENITKFGAD